MSDKKALEYEALIAEIQAICVEVEGMKWDNEIRKRTNFPIFYDESQFYAKAELLRELAQKIRNLI